MSIDIFSFNCRWSREHDILELELIEKKEQLKTLQDELALLTTEISQLRDRELDLVDRDYLTDVEKTGNEVEQLHLEIEQLREDSARKCRVLEGTVERLRSENNAIRGNKFDKLTSLQERVQELEAENTHFRKLGSEPRMRGDLERKIEKLENEKRNLVRERIKTEEELRQEIRRLKLELDEVRDLVNRRDDNLILTDKVFEVRKIRPLRKDFNISKKI